MSSAHTSLIPGLVSITFRKLTVEQVLELAAQAGLRSIEWGGDVHVPHGDLPAAKRARELGQQAGITVSAYGSYYPLATPEKSPPFQAVLDSALALGTQCIRVWAGTQGSAEAGADQLARVRDDLRHTAAIALPHGVDVALEYHANTLTDTPESTQAVLADMPANVKIYWQPRHQTPVEASLADIDLLRPRLANAHVFHWLPDPSHRLPLSDGEDRWQQYLARLSDGTPRHVSLEFVRNDDPQQLKDDAATLLRLLGE